MEAVKAWSVIRSSLEEDNQRGVRVDQHET
jgi:hypothetical protein